MKFIFSPFFGYIIKFLHVAWKITNPSHDDIYLRIFVKIFSEGRRQDFSSDHKVFPNQPKKLRMLQMTIYLRISGHIFSEGRRQEKYSFSTYVIRVGGQKKSCFDLAENRAADSLWIGAYRYTRIKFASKLLLV